MNIGLITSGGDAPGMNAFISNFVKLCGKKHSIHAFKFGFQGLIDNEVLLLTKKDTDHISHLGGSFIKSFRSSEFLTEKGFDKAVKNLKKNQIDCLVILGGDGTLKGAQKLEGNGIKIIFVPATIDNDLFYIDKTLGFDSAVNCAVEYIDKIKQTMLSLNRIFICEVMGRKCSDIASYCAVATNASFLIAEKEDCDFDKIAEKIRLDLKNGDEAPHIIARENTVDVNDLAKKLQNHFDIETRASVIGYVQRGTSPSIYDRIYAKQLASFSLELINKSRFGLAIGILNNNIISTSLSSAISDNSRNSEDLTKFI